MNTFLDMENTFLSIYKEALLKYPNKEESIFLGVGLDGFLEESQEELDRQVYMMEQIQMLSDHEYNDFISLLALYYFSFYGQDVEEEIEWESFDDTSEDYDEIIHDMIMQDKKEFLEQVKDPACDHLMDMVEFFIKEEIECLLTEEEIERGYIEDLDKFDWSIIINSLKNNLSKEVFIKFHPNLEDENKEYMRYKNNEYYLDKLLEIPIHSSNDFFRVFALAKVKLSTENYLEHFLVSLAQKQQMKNQKMSHQIALIILKYYYVENCLHNKENKDDFVFEIAKCIEDIDNFWFEEEIIKSFSKFNSLKFKKAISKLSFDEILIFNKLLTLENRKIYGSKGSWKCIDLETEYDEIKDTFLKYCPTWICYLNNFEKEKKQMYIYYSENEKKEHTIPRLCLYVNSTGKIENIEGRFDGNKIEYEMLDVVKEKIKEFVYPKRISDDINYLTIMANINKKLDQKEDLNLNEIEFLYEINEKVDSHYLLRRRYLEEKTDKKRIWQDTMVVKQKKL